MLRKFIFSIFIFLLTVTGFLVLPPLLFTSAINRWLSVHEPAEAGILVVEGWLPEYTSVSIYKEFVDGGYELLLTTGQPLDDVLNVSYNGFVEFDLEAAGVVWDEYGTVTVSLFAFGEAAKGEYARYTIMHGKDTIGRGYTGSSMQEFRFGYDPQGADPGSIKVVFDNDFVYNGEDRNLHIRKLKIDDHILPVRSENTSLVRLRGGSEFRRTLRHRTLAEEKAWFLQQQGIDSTSIISLDVPEVRRFRTFTDAVTVSEWIRENKPYVRTISIFSEGNHSRRSRALYTYALPASFQVGVIQVTRPGPGESSRPGSLSAKVDVLREYLKFIYTKTLFDSGWHYRRIKNKING